VTNRACTEAALNFFVSYTQADLEWARWIAWSLEEGGYRVLFDEWDRVPGSNLVNLMNRGVTHAERTVAVLSPDYSSSVYGSAEWQSAWHKDPQGLERKLITVRIRDGCMVDDLLAKVVRIDLVGLPEPSARQRLLKGIEAARLGRDKPESPPPFPLTPRTVPDQPRFPGERYVGDFVTESDIIKPRCCTLPKDIWSFTGRDDEWQKLMSAVTGEEEGRAVTGGVVQIYAINGMPGIGKTTFAVHAAHLLAEHFPDGQCFLCLHGHTGQDPVDPAEALESLLRAIGVAPDEIPADLDARASLWRECLAGKRMLLVLDDAAEWEQVKPLLPGRAGNLVLITSRDRSFVPDDTVPISLGELTLDDAAELFLRVAERPDLQPTDTGIAEVNRLVGCHPLAIRLMAAQLRQHRAWTAVNLATELTEAPNRLTVINPRERPADERSIVILFDLSYRDLTTEQRHLFRQLSLHPGIDIDIHAAAALGNVECSVARARLRYFHDLHLINEDPLVRDRYRFHDLLREYARTLAATDPPVERAAALERLLNYHLRVAGNHAEHAGWFLLRHNRPSLYPSPEPTRTGHTEALRWFDTESDTLQAWLRHAQKWLDDFAQRVPNVAESRLGAQLVTLTAAMAGYLRNNGPWDVAEQAHDTAYKIAEILDDPCAKAIALNDLGITCRLMSNHGKATEALQEAHKGFCELTDLRTSRLGQANTLNELGIVENEKGRESRKEKHHNDAARVLAEARDLYLPVGDPIGIANSTKNLGVAQHRLHKFDKAQDLLNQSLKKYENIDDVLGIIEVHNHLGRLYLESDDDAQRALDEFHTVRSIIADGDGIESPREEAIAWEGIGDCQQINGEKTKAERSFRKAEEIYSRIGARQARDHVAEKLRKLCRSRAGMLGAEARHGGPYDVLG
jgi:tetratricopeptide (TPR) repeat protein